MLTETKINSSGTVWYKTTPDGTKLVIGDSYYFVGQWWVYVGDFTDISRVPNVDCCYTIGNQIRVHRKFRHMSSQGNIRKVTRKRADDSRPINTDITDQDGMLMVMMKEILAKKHITRGVFKDLYKGADSDMNNCLRLVEQGNSLTFARFEDLCSRIKLPYKVTVYDTDGSILSEADSREPARPEPVFKTPAKKK